MSAPGRKRIVINLDRQPRTGPLRKPTRWSIVLSLIAIGLVVILLVVGVSGYLWWRHYQTTPVYSLALIVDAAQRNDMVTFNRLVNSEKIVDSLATEAANSATSRFGLPRPVLSSPLTAVTPLLPDELKATFRGWLADEIKQFSSAFGTKPFVFIALTLPAVVKVSSDENTARVESTLRDQPVELIMQRDGETWKLVGLKNDGLLTRILDEVRKNLPAIAPIDAVEPGARIRRQRR